VATHHVVIFHLNDVLGVQAIWTAVVPADDLVGLDDGSFSVAEASVPRIEGLPRPGWVPEGLGPVQRVILRVSIYMFLSSVITDSGACEVAQA
jgi:hypothetical protein